MSLPREELASLVFGVRGLHNVVHISAIMHFVSALVLPGKEI